MNKLANFSTHRPVRIGRTTNRQLGFITPSASEQKCDFFSERFIRHGSALKENRAICEKHNNGVICDYQKQVGGVPFCLRYWYGPLYEIVDELAITPYEQKVDANGNYLYYETDGITETITYTSRKVMVTISEKYPIQYLKDAMEQEKDTTGKLLFWDLSQTPAIKTEDDTGVPVLLPNSAKEFYSTHYEDTHEKRFGVIGNRMGWHHE